MNLLKLCFTHYKSPVIVTESYIKRLLQKTKFSKTQILSFKQIFTSLLKPGQRELDEDSFTDQLNILNNKYNKKLAEKIFRALDDSENGLLDFEEFLVYFHVIQNGTEAERLDLSFKIMDSDRDGKITKKDLLEIIDLMTRIHSMVDGGLSIAKDQNAVEKIVEVIFERIDLDGNGTISHSEFMQVAQDADDLGDFFELLCGKGFEGIFAYSREGQKRRDEERILDIVCDDLTRMRDFFEEHLEVRKGLEGGVDGGGEEGFSEVVRPLVHKLGV